MAPQTMTPVAAPTLPDAPDVAGGVAADAEAYLRGLRTQGAPGRQLHEILGRHTDVCACPLSYRVRRWNEVLGTLIEIRLCCLARAMEALTGQQFLEAFEFTPLWQWDCTQLLQQPDGSFAQRGAPPADLAERLRRKGLSVLNSTADKE